jgi:hypothetical protein
VRDTIAAAAIRNLLVREGVPVTEGDRSRRATSIPLETALELIRAVPVGPDESSIWDPDAMIALVHAYQDRLGDQCIVYVRGFEGGDVDENRTRGRLGGVEINEIRRVSPHAPALALIYVGDDPENPEGWFPTMVMPRGSPAYVFNNEYE